MQSFTKACRLAAEASSITRIRIRPVPCPSAWAAITTKALLSVCRPAAFLQPADHRLVHLHPPAQSIPIRSDHSPSQFVQPSPSCLITPQSEDPLQAQRAGTVLLAGHIPHGTKPHHQRLPRVLENRARRGRGLVPATAALKQGGTDQDSLGSLALRTAKPLRPPEADQVRSTRLLRRKALLKLLDSSRIVFHDQIGRASCRGRG